MRYYIYGTTDLAENLFYLLEEEGRKIEGFTVDRQYIAEQYKALEIHGETVKLPIISFDVLKGYPDKKEIGIYLCIGYTQMNAASRRILECTLKSETEILFIQRQ